MVKGRIWGTVCGEYGEMEIDECDVIAAIGLKVPDEDDRVDTQATALGMDLQQGILLHRWQEVWSGWF